MHPSACPCAATQPARFEIDAEHCPQVVARIVDVFAARALMLRELHARRSGAGMWIAVEIDLEPRLVEPIAERIRSMVAVRAVLAAGPAARQAR